MSSKDCESCKKTNQNRKIIGFTDFNCEMILYHPSKYWFYENFYPDCFDTFSLPMFYYLKSFSESVFSTQIVCTLQFIFVS